MKLTVETITPQQAQTLLEANTNNRRLREHLIDQYAQHMTRSEWSVTGEPIIFDKKGVLLNGQHRLRACVKAGVAFTTAVARGADPDVYQHIDSGMKRTVSDLARQTGFTQPTVVAAAARLVLSYRAGVIGNSRAVDLAATRTAIMEELDEWQGLYQGSSDITQIASKRGAIPAGFMAFRVLCGQINGEGSSDEFLQGVVSGEGLQAGDPRLALQNVVVGPNRPKISAQYLAVIVRAYQAWVANEPRCRIQGWSAGNPFPAVPVLKPRR